MLSKRNLVIFGAGEFAQIAGEYFSYDSEFSVAAFAVDDDWLDQAKQEVGASCPVISVEEANSELDRERTSAFVAIPATGLNSHRMAMVGRVRSMGFTLATYVSSRAFVWRNVELGDNCFIFENNVLQPFVKVGDGVIMWSGNHVGHRTVIEDFAFLTSHVVVSGYCRVGAQSFLGVNATINDGISIGPRCVIGAGSHVNRDTEEGRVYVGSPARALSDRSSADVDL